MSTSLSFSKEDNLELPLFRWPSTSTGSSHIQVGKERWWLIQKKTETCFGLLSLCIWKGYPKSTKFRLLPTIETKWFLKTGAESSTKSRGISLAWGKVKLSLTYMVQRLLPGVMKKAWHPL